LDSYL